jgi:signal transduction histidine kinase
MLQASNKLKLILFFDAFIFLICTTGLICINHKAKLPFDLHGQDSLLTIKHIDQKATGISEGDKLISVDGFQINSVEETEFITDRHDIGDFINIEIISSSGKLGLKAELINYYSTVYLISTSAVALFFFVIALFVLIKRAETKAAVIFHWASISVSVMLCLTWSNLNTFSHISLYLSRVILLIAYVAAPALFVHFTLIFPTDNTYKWSNLLKINYSIAFIISALSIYTFVYAITFTCDNSIKNFLTAFNYVRFFLIINVVLSITIFIINLNKEKNKAKQKQLKWLLFGFLVGPLSFVLLWVIPILLKGKALIPEEIIMVLICAIPVTFSIAIIRYRMLDIDEVINRSLVYGIVITILLALYSGVIGITVSTLHISDQSIISAVAAVFLGLLFQPIKTKVQYFVAKRFFRIRYNFRKELSKLSSEIKNFNDINSLGKYLITEIDRLIPVDKIAFCEFDLQTGKLIIKNHKNFEALANKSLRIKSETLEKKGFDVAAIKNKVDNEVDISSIFQNTLIRWKINLVIPIKSVNEELFGFLLLGNKKSGAKFTSEDVDLLKEIGLSAGSTIERLSLQEQLIREKMEAERLEELNRQKSMFVSTVSHELKTPLTSIKMFSELLRQREKNISETSKSHLEIIEGESDRLTRLINNVLNFSKIEKGVKEYSFREINFNIIVKKVLNTMQYSIKMKGFNLKTHLSEFDDLVFADEDAIIEAVENLISNAIRFSGDKNEIEINTFEENNFVCISIRDFGIGIESKDIDKIFDQFYRSQNVKIRNIDGTGLGLPIVKHIVEAHKGKIFVESKLGKGSKFTLCFPKSNKGENNEENFNNRR